MDLDLIKQRLEWRMRKYFEIHLNYFEWMNTIKNTYSTKLTLKIFLCYVSKYATSLVKCSFNVNILFVTARYITHQVYQMRYKQSRKCDILTIYGVLSECEC